MQRSAPPPRPRAVQADVPEAAEQIILKLLEKDPRKRFRDGHHLQEELKAFQRSLPSTTWDNQKEQQDLPAAPPPPPPAATPSVVEWSRRASHFARLVARAYPNGRAPAEIQQAADRMWELAARASRLEGELASHSRKLEAIERRGRALRAEIGRKVEELAAEESRALREAGGERERIAAVTSRVHEAKKAWEAHARRAEEAERAGGDIVTLRQVFEESGGARAKVEALRMIIDDVETRAKTREKHAQDLRKQIDDLRAQLTRYGDALENDLAAGRERIATRVREALSYEKAFMDAMQLLMGHLRGRPECRDVFEELALDAKEQEQSDSSMPKSKAAPVMPGQGGNNNP
jgi:serine/threonine-protein kinase